MTDYPTEDAKWNWKAIADSGVQYYSWGFHTSVVLFECSKTKYEAVFVSSGNMELLKTFEIKMYVDYHHMISLLNQWNYHTCSICPEVKAALDW